MAKLYLPLDFKEFLQLLNEHQVEYMLIGGYAVAYYGYPRSTGDMDIWIALNEQNANQVMKAIIAFGFNESNLSRELFLKENQIIRLGTPPLRIEITTGIPGVQFSDCYPLRVIDNFDDIKVHCISLEHLKTNKKAAGRFKDLNDLENLP
ncbi:MAG: hypothetical protein WCL90_04030 [Planctomycetota bacterium]|jgi:hypothetical protein